MGLDIKDIQSAPKPKVLMVPYLCKGSSSIDRMKRTCVVGRGVLIPYLFLPLCTLSILLH